MHTDYIYVYTPPAVVPSVCLPPLTGVPHEGSDRWSLYPQHRQQSGHEEASTMSAAEQREERWGEVAALLAAGTTWVSASLIVGDCLPLTSMSVPRAAFIQVKMA